MAGDILSQQEIDSLLQSLTSGEAVKNKIVSFKGKPYMCIKCLHMVYIVTELEVHRIFSNNIWCKHSYVSGEIIKKYAELIDGSIKSKIIMALNNA